MPRSPTPIWYASKKAYMCTYRGQRYTLHKCDQCDKPDGPHFLRALEVFSQKMKESSVPALKDCSFACCADRWISYLQDHGAAATASSSKYLLKSAVATFGSCLADCLPWNKVFGWIDGRKSWGPSTRATAYRRLSTCLTWNVEQGFLLKNTIAGKKLPKSWKEEIRGEEFVLPEELQAVVLAAVQQRLQGCVFFCCRNWLPARRSSRRWRIGTTTATR